MCFSKLFSRREQLVHSETVLQHQGTKNRTKLKKGLTNNCSEQKTKSDNEGELRLPSMRPVITLRVQYGRQIQDTIPSMREEEKRKERQEREPPRAQPWFSDWDCRNQVTVFPYTFPSDELNHSTAPQPEIHLECQLLRSVICLIRWVNTSSPEK